MDFPVATEQQLRGPRTRKVGMRGAEQNTPTGISRRQGEFERMVARRAGAILTDAPTSQLHPPEPQTEDGHLEALDPATSHGAQDCARPVWP